MQANPPISEIGFTLQFEPLADLTFVDLADLYAQFKAEYPVHQQVPLLPSMPLETGPPPGGAVIQFQSVGPELPRVWFIAADAADLVQFQADRFCHNWRQLNRQEPTAVYPGYAATRDRFMSELDRLGTWLSGRDRAAFRPVLGELLYVDTIPMPAQDPPIRLSSIFRPFKPTARRPIGLFSMSWRETLEEPLKGLVNVAFGVQPLAEGTPAAIMQTIARFDISDAPVEAIRDRFDATHALLIEIFAENIEDNFSGVRVT